MKNSNKDKGLYAAAIVLAVLLSGLVMYSIVVNFEVFQSSDDPEDSGEENGNVLPIFGTQDVTKENLDKKIIIRENSVAFSDPYTVIRKITTNGDDRFDCAFSETNCLFYELENKENGYTYFISENTPIVLKEKPIFSTDKNSQIEVGGENVDVVVSIVTTIPDDNVESEGPNLDLAVELTQEIYGCMPNSQVCFSSGLISIDKNKEEIAMFLNFLNNLKYE